MVRRFPIVVAVLLAGGLAWTAAQPPAKPIELQPRPAQFAPIGPTAVRQLEENVELLDAQLDTKRAYVKAAEVTLAGSAEKFKLTKEGYEKNQVSYTDFMAVKAERDMAVAQVDIRKAEMKEVEVKLKHAKRRLEEMKGQPAPKGNPFRKPGGEVKELQTAVALLEVKLVKAKTQVEKAKAVIELAKKEEQRLKELVLKGIVPKEDLDKAAASVQVAELDLKIALAEVAEVEVELRAAKQRLEDASK